MVDSGVGVVAALCWPTGKALAGRLDASLAAAATRTETPPPLCAVAVNSGAGKGTPQAIARRPSTRSKTPDVRAVLFTTPRPRRIKHR
jgi:hypothetical protein